MPFSMQETTRPNVISIASLACVLAAIVSYVIGFATVGWESTKNWGTYNGQPATAWFGLWASCLCASVSIDYNRKAWFTATQATCTIALILLVLAGVTRLVYAFLPTQSTYKHTLIRLFVASVFFAVFFMLIGFVIYAANHAFAFEWSYAFSIIGAILGLVSGVLAFFQICGRSSGGEL